MASSPFKTSRKTQECVWVSTDLMEACAKGKRPKRRPRHRTTDDWGWCRATLVNATTTTTDNNNNDWRRQASLNNNNNKKSLEIDIGEIAPEEYQQQTITLEYDDTAETAAFVVPANVWEDDPSLAPTDLTLLEQLHEPAVVYCLQCRYQHDQIYTYTGKILLALNPFRTLPHLYGPDTAMPQYWTNNKATNKRPPPHIYAVAEDAYRSANQTYRPKDQSILVSGESGAGKTVTTKIILQYLAVVSQQQQANNNNNTTTVGVETQVLESNPILESFGNARTIRNDNSSRFGKFISLQFDHTNGCLVSAHIETYLLEKVRLLSQAAGERNYHVFYELLQGVAGAERSALQLRRRTARDFRMTCVSGTFDRRDGVSDSDMYGELRTALDTVGFSQREQLDLFTVASALLWTSNLTFVEESADASMLDVDNPSCRFAVDLLGVRADDLNAALCTVAIEARGETLYKQLPIERAEKALEALIKTTYGALFAHIVRRINSFITVRGEAAVRSNLKTTSIGVLDIFGFESFDQNSFEQLCINYCNEALQQQFNRFVFKLEQQEYKDEGIDWSFITFPDNQDILDLIDKKHDGILSVLDEQCRLPRCTDATFAQAIYQKCRSHSRFQVTRTMEAQLSFAIHHYAGLVEYDTSFFLEKNKDELPKETTELLRSSKYPFLSLLGHELTETSSPSTPSHSLSKNSRQLKRTPSSLLRDSVGTQFCSQLRVLRKRIETTEPHYVRCLKPNDELQPDSFNPLVIADQLRCAGVLEAIRVSRVGFPNRYFHTHFVQRYGLLEPGAMLQHKNRQVSARDLCSRLVDLLNPMLAGMEEFTDSDNPSGAVSKADESLFLGMQVGKTKVFIRRRAYETLEYLRGKKLDDSATKIQSVARMFLRKINYEIAIYAVTLIQKFVRQITAYRLMRGMRIEHAALVMQRALRCFKARRLLNSARSIALWCQSAFRGAIARQYCAYLFLDLKASCIQRAWRRYNGSIGGAFRKFRCAVVCLQNRHRSRKAVRELWHLRKEARDLARVAAERDRFKNESMRLRKELEEARQSPEKPPSPPAKDAELEHLRSELQGLRSELVMAQQMVSPSKSTEEKAQELEAELLRREEELSVLRREVTALRSRDDLSSLKSLTIETRGRDTVVGSSVTGNSFNSPRHRASPARSDVSLLDDESDEDCRSKSSSVHLEVASNELQHLHAAVRKKNKKQFDQVLRQTGEACVLVNQGDRYGRTSMHLAALSDDTYMAEKLIDRGAVVNAQDDDGETPLHLADNADMVQLLVKKGKANTNIPNVDGICALHLAVQRRDVDTVRTLVMNNANVNNADNIRWFTALHLIALPARNAATENCVDDTRCRIARLLTGVYGQTPPDLNYQDSEGNSPLHYAVQLETDDACDLVTIFLEKEADPNLKNTRDQVPLHLLCHNDGLRKKSNFPEIVHALLSNGADPSIQSRTGCTPLHLSLYHRDVDTAVQLVRNGAQLHHVWKKPKRWEAFWKEKEPSGVLALDMVEDGNDLLRILSAVTTPQDIAPSRSFCMQCKGVLRSFSRSVHCRNCGRLTCAKCSGSCMPAEFFPHGLKLSEPSWTCMVCEKILASHREVMSKDVMSNATQPTSSYGDEEEDRFSC